ncbi:PEP-CTERM sorting domain-containing protein [Pelomonas sp. Root1444]|uniref:PEP-CTERM sorting domain-containing protein n=1 Tax=Pelomonas sp. Root1444 TaxID=1736464 RepID=UPI0009EBFDEB|nr:PEP-CTERM sorting domain-containing protein [Pelomonas sp. Root1444]
MKVVGLPAVTAKLVSSIATAQIGTTLSISVLAVVLFPAVQANAAEISSVGSGSTLAALQPRDLDDDGVVDAFYDAAFDITWLREVGTQSFRNWAAATAWAEQDRFGISGWRLPSTVQPDATCSWTYNQGFGPESYGWGCRGSELGHLWSDVLGNTPEYVPSPSGGLIFNAGYGLRNAADFQGLVVGNYWTSTPWVQRPDSHWRFNTGNGFQDVTSGVVPQFAMAVRQGDVASVVPEPSTWILISLGFASLLVRRQLALRGPRVSNMTGSDLDR